jgi:GDPmannose 4,6-dehydratase
MSKIALITGITGQDGSYLAELLLKKKYVVHGFLREQNREKATKNLWRIKKNLQSLKLHRVNPENEDKIKRLLNLIKPDEIYHLAAQAYDGHSFDNEFYTIETNLNYTHKILSLAKKANLNTKFFFAGSSEMYSKDIKTKINEKTIFSPKSAYGIAKVASFYLIKNYREIFNFNASTGILFNHESPRKDDNFVLKKIAKSVARIKFGLQKKIKLGDIKSKRDWGHAKDYVYAMWLINKQKKASDYIIGTGKLHSVEDFLKKAFKYVGLNYKKYLIIDQKLFRKKDSKARIANPNKLIKKLKWKRKFNFEQLVKDMVENELTNLKNNSNHER